MTTVDAAHVSPTDPESRPAKRHRTRNNGRNDDGKALDQAEGVKESPSDKAVRTAKKVRSSGEDPEALFAGQSSSAVSPNGPTRNADKEAQSIGEDGSQTKRAFCGALHNRLVMQRRKIDELRLAIKDKDRIVHQYKTMWAREKDKNQQLLNRLEAIEKKLAAMTRPLQRSIKSMMTASSFPAQTTNASLSECAITADQ